LLCCVAVAAGVFPDAVGAEAPLRCALAAALDENARLRTENARLRERDAERETEIRQLRERYVRGDFPKGEYSDRVDALRRRYPVLALHAWQFAEQSAE